MLPNISGGVAPVPHIPAVAESLQAHQHLALSILPNGDDLCGLPFPDDG